MPRSKDRRGNVSKTQYTTEVPRGNGPAGPGSVPSDLVPEPSSKWLQQESNLLAQSAVCLNAVASQGIVDRSEQRRVGLREYGHRFLVTRLPVSLQREGARNGHEDQETAYVGLTL